MAWWVARLKPAGGATACRELISQGYVPYLPVLRAERLKRGKVLCYNIALFPSYLFIDTSQFSNDRNHSPIRQINGTKGVQRLLMSGTQPAMIPNEFIVELKSQERNGAIPAARPARWHKGQAIKVRSGQFAGLDALYNGRASVRDREMVLLNLMGRLTRVELDANDIS